MRGGPGSAGSTETSGASVGRSSKRVISGFPFRQLGIFNSKCLVHPAANATVILKFIHPAGVGEDHAGDGGPRCPSAPISTCSACRTVTRTWIRALIDGRMRARLRVLSRTVTRAIPRNPLRMPMHEMTDKYLRQMSCGAVLECACVSLRTCTDEPMHKISRRVVRGLSRAVSRHVSHKIFPEVSDTLLNEIAHEIVHALACET